MNVLVYNSAWANAGNGWYGGALREMLKEMYPDACVRDGDSPVEESFTLHAPFMKRNAFDLFLCQRADLHVLNGPILPVCTNKGWYGKKIKDIVAHGEKYCIISACGTEANEQIRSEALQLLQENPPLFITTRDEDTYLWLKGKVKNLYNGICCAWLVDKYLKPQKFTLEKPFFISSWYRELEPAYILSNQERCSVENLTISHKKTCLGLPYRFSRHLNFLFRHQSEIGGFNIVRTVQQISTRFNHINFATPNSFISFHPEMYLDVVKSSEFTISDRVHACVISLACGRPCRFVFETKRAGVFTRMGFEYQKNNGVMYPNLARIDDELGLLKAEIRKYLG